MLLTAASAFDSRRFQVYTNPGPFRRVAVGRAFPDLVVCLRPTVLVAAVGEVETASTVTEDEAAEWEALAGLGVERCYLFLPWGWEERASALLGDRGLEGRFILVSYRDFGGAVLLRGHGWEG
ncbi:MAG: hypothetical protein K6T75_07645 [Acetobacteraceae bacterium]|nr:hypothetical protein [Acetobacteraceae bacterium]